MDCERNFREPVLTDLRDKFYYLYKKTGKLKTNEFFYLFEEFIKIRSGEKGWGQIMKDVYQRLLEKIRGDLTEIAVTAPAKLKLEEEFAPLTESLLAVKEEYLSTCRIRKSPRVRAFLMYYRHR